MKLDPVDVRLLALLREDARLSFRDLAARVGVSTPTVSVKVRALESLGVIRGYHAELDPARIGQALHVLEVEAAPARTAGLASRIRPLPGVTEVLELAGGRLHVRFAASRDHLILLLDALGRDEDVARFHLHVVLDRHATRGEPPGELDVQVACHECKGPIHGAGVRKRWDADGHQDHWFCCRGCAGRFEERLLRTAVRARRKRA